MTKKILEASLSVFLVVCTLVLILMMLNWKPIIDKYSASIDAQINTANTLKVSIDNLSSEYLSLLREQAKNQKALLENFNKSNTVLYEAGIAIGSRFMEAEGSMSPTDANRIIIDSISKINKVDERLGTLAKALNDAASK